MRKLRPEVLLCFGAYVPKAHFRTSWLFPRFFLGFVHQPRMAFTLTSLKEGDGEINGDDVFPGPNPSGDACLEATPENVWGKQLSSSRKDRKQAPGPGRES